MRRNSGKANASKFWSFNKKDVILVAVVLAAAVVLLSVYQLGNGRNDEETAGGVLEITIDGELYGNFSLSEDREMVITSPYGNNTVVIEQGRVFVKEADCPDRICVEMQEISSDGGIICCLPHRLYLTMRVGESAGYDAVAY